MVTEPGRNGTVTLVLVAAILAFRAHGGLLLDPHRAVGDARQHVFWTYRFADADLFPNDPLVRFISSPRFDPPGYTAVYGLGARIIDALLFSKLLGFGLSLWAGWMAFRLGRHLMGGRFGGLLLVAVGFVIFDDTRGGLPRSFGFPLLLTFVDGLARGRAGVCGAAVLGAALFYPPLLPGFALLLPMFLGLSPKVWWPKIRSLLVPVGLPSLAAVGVLAYTYGAADQEFIGPMVTRDQALSMAEFQPGGRNAFWSPDPWTFWVGDLSYRRSAFGLFTGNMLWPLVVWLGFSLVARLVPSKRALDPCPPWIPWMLVSSAILFLVAHGVLFRMFLPSRYTLYPWPIGLTVLAVRAAYPWILSFWTTSFRWLQTGLGQGALLGLLAVLVVGAANRPGTELSPFVTWASHLPKDVLIAGLPESMDEVPLHARRSVLANQELSLAYFQGYYGVVKSRVDASLALVFATDRDAAMTRAQSLGVTHLVIPAALRNGDAVGTQALLDRLLLPWRTPWSAAFAQASSTCWVRDQDRDWKPIYEDAEVSVFAVSR